MIGFVPEADTIPWKHSLTLAFTNPANRERVLFFKDRAGLVDMLNSDKLLVDAEQIRKQIADGKLPPTSPVDLDRARDLRRYAEAVLSAADPRRRHDRAEVRLQGAHGAGRLGDQGEGRRHAGRRSASAAIRRPISAKFTSGVVFVIDASASMQPYIDLTRAAMEEVYKQVEAAKLEQRVRFGMVAYRDDPTKVKGIEYLVRTFADPTKVSTQAQFADAVKGVAASEVSTRAFAEDGYAGLAEAIQGIDWTGFGGRYLIMITDASSREGNSPLATTGLGTDQVRAAGAGEPHRHLRALPEDAGGQGRSRAGDQAVRGARQVPERRLAVLPGRGRRQAGVPKPGAAARRGAGQPGPLGRPEAGERRVRSASAAAAAGDKLTQVTEKVGRAMQLAYLGEVQGTKAPRMFEAWASDRDFKQPDIASFSVRLLLTKNQLSDLQATLRKVVEAGEKGQLDPGDFFNQLRSAAAAMSRDPNRVGQAGARNLEDIGLMGEYLDGLPYQSRIMGLDQDTWTRMGVGQQQALIDDVKSKIALYQRFHDDVDRWVQLNPEGAPATRSIPMPLDVLP